MKEMGLSFNITEISTNLVVGLIFIVLIICILASNAGENGKDNNGQFIKKLKEKEKKLQEKEEKLRQIEEQLRKAR